jgi:hypothetical protein
MKQLMQKFFSKKFLKENALLNSVVVYFNSRSWGSSVSVVSDYRLDDWGLIPSRGKGFFH